MARLRFQSTLAIIAGLKSSYTLFAQSILYVDDSATVANNGSSWCNAFVLRQDALAGAEI